MGYFNPRQLIIHLVSVNGRQNERKYKNDRLKIKKDKQACAKNNRKPVDSPRTKEITKNMKAKRGGLCDRVGQDDRMIGWEDERMTKNHHLRRTKPHGHTQDQM